MFAEMVLIPREEYERNKKARQEILAQESGGPGGVNIIQQWSKPCPSPSPPKQDGVEPRAENTPRPRSPSPGRPKEDKSPPQTAAAPPKVTEPPTPAEPPPAQPPVAPPAAPSVQLPVRGFLPQLVPLSLGSAPPAPSPTWDTGQRERAGLQKNVEADIPASFEQWDEHVGKSLDVISSAVREIGETNTQGYEALEKRIDDLQQDLSEDLFSGLQKIPGGTPSAPRSDKALLERLEKLYNNHFDRLHANIAAQEEAAKELSTALLAKLGEIEKAGVRDPGIDSLRESIQNSSEDLVGRLDKLLADSAKYQEKEQQKQFDHLTRVIDEMNEESRKELGRELEKQRAQQQEELRQQRELLQSVGEDKVGGAAQKEFLLKNSGEEEARLREVLDHLLARIFSQSAGSQSAAKNKAPPITPPLNTQPKSPPPNSAQPASKTEKRVGPPSSATGPKKALSTTAAAERKSKAATAAKNPSPLPPKTKSAFAGAINNDLKPGARASSGRAAAAPPPGSKKVDKPRIKEEPNKSVLRGQGAVYKPKLKRRARRRILSSLRKIINLEPLNGSNMRTCQ